MELLLAGIIVLFMVGLVVTVHYEALRIISGIVVRPFRKPRTMTLLVIAGVLTAHLLEICLYAVCYYSMQMWLGLGSIAGELDVNALDFFYFSATTYSTLGVGDLVPTGAIRLVVGVEALNGFVLIGWSASYTYLTMQGSWNGRQRKHP